MGHKLIGLIHTIRCNEFAIISHIINKMEIYMTFIRRKEVERRTGLSRSSIYEHMSQGTFPKNFKVGLRAVAWLEQDIDEWMQSRMSNK